MDGGAKLVVVEGSVCCCALVYGGAVMGDSGIFGRSKLPFWCALMLFKGLGGTGVVVVIVVLVAG